ncbi:alcohol dehydrogenase [Grosmannia clavigera kw1407]|uniref:Alcohol dehydrogenase n=1 Tax=Grosmannia clavigera (strain kw1407 / UAMH 11150) TaxID=655863 RepID=F0XTC8_GROCL|nr:alcohol dehydrogenase [Grosmannia clavigera kw1407]EFW98961.1 alcohol dehydrogenase [Grosmannia clavigera kw1407]
MEALQITRHGDSVMPTLSLVTCPVPKVRPGFALVRIRFAGVQPSDRLNARGGFPKTTFPRTPGRDYSGEVVEVDKSSGLDTWVGKHIYGTSNSELGFTVDGTHAEFCLIPESVLVEKPAQLSLSQAAAIGVPYTTALRCLTRARAGPEDTVLVLGASGAVGSAAVKIARVLGCKRVLVASRKRQDSPDVLLPGPDSSVALQEQIQALTQGRGVSVVVDTVGSIALMSEALEQLAVRGRYVWIAAPRDGSSAMLQFDIFQAYRKEAEFIGCNSGIKSNEELKEEMLTISSMFGTKQLKAPGDGDIERVSLKDSVKKGYGARGLKRHVVIKM